MPNEPDLYLTLLIPASTNYAYPSAYVAAKTFEDVLAYEMGSLIHFMSQSPGNTVNVAGNMTIANTPNVNVAGGTMNVNINGTPTMNLAPGASVGISGTANVSIQGSPTMTLAAGATINVGNSPQVSFAPGAPWRLRARRTSILHRGAS